MDVSNSIPVVLVDAMKKEIPAFFKEMDRRNEDGNNDWMKAECFCPISFALREVLKNRNEQDLRKATIHEHVDAAYLATLVNWNKSKVIYDFDPDVSIELLKQSENELKVTSDLIKLPTWGVYISLPGSEIEGVFVSLEWTPQTKALCIFTIVDNGKYVMHSEPIYLPLPEKPRTIDEIVDTMFFRSMGMLKKQGMTLKEINDTVAEKKYLIKFVVNALFYLTAVNSDIVLKKPTENKDKGKATGVKQYKVGEKTGARLRTFHKAHVIYTKKMIKEHHESPVMHIRRAHWHTYLKGKGRKEKELKWLLPIIVNRDGKEIDVVSLVKVKEGADTPE